MSVQIWIEGPAEWFRVIDKRNFYKDLIVVTACLVVGVSCFLSIECVIKVTRKELLEWSNILLPSSQVNVKKFCTNKDSFFSEVILLDSAFITYYDWPTTLLRQILIKILFDWVDLLCRRICIDFLHFLFQNWP